MTLLLRHLFTGVAGTFALNGASPNTVNSMPGGATTFGFAAGTCTLDGSGYATADAARVVKINIPVGDQTTHDWVVAVRAKYDKATPVATDPLDIGILTGTGDTHQYFLRSFWSSGTNYYTTQFRRLPAATVGANNVALENTQDIDGNAIVVGTNNTAGDVWFYAKKVGTTFWAGFDVGRGIKWFPSATDATFSEDGVPWFSLYSGTWKVAEVQVWTGTDKKFIVSGNFDPTIDPRTQPNLRRHFDMSAEMALANPYVGGWWPGQFVGTNPWVSATPQSGKFTGGFSWSSGSGNMCWYPGHGLVPARKTTVGIWLHMTTDWASWAGGVYILEVGDPGASDNFNIRRATATTFIVNYIQKIGATVNSTDLGGFSFPFGDVPLAGDDVLFTITIRSDGRIEAGVNGNLCIGGRSGFTGGKIVAGQWFEAGTNLAGLLVGFHVAAGTRNANCNFSDIFVLTGDHYPNHPIPAALPNTLTVTPASVPAGIALSVKHVGVLGSSITSGGAWETFTAGKLGLVRDSAKKLLASPMELSSGGNGSTATTLGPTSGTPWWWDWQVVDRDMVRDAAAVNFGGGNYGYILIGLSGVPRRMQDAGGTLTAYYSGTNLTTNTSQSQSFVANIPNFNATNTGTIGAHTVVLSTGANSTCDAWAYACSDLVLHIKAWCLANGFPFANILFNYWNEGDTSNFWKTTNCFTNQRAELAKLYNAAVTKIQAQSGLSAFKMSFIPSVQYASADINAFMAAVHTATNDAGVDAIDIHDYQGGSYSGVDFLVRTADADRVTNSIASALPTVISEDGMNNIITPGFGSSYFQVGDNPPNSMAVGAAWVAHRILACAKSKATSGKTFGISEYVFTAATMNTLSAYGASGLLTSGSGFPTAILNAFDLLCRMATDVPGVAGSAHGTAVWNGVPGIGHICTVLLDGTVRVLVVNFRTRPDSTETVNIQLPNTYANRRVNHYVVDDQNGSYFDTAGVSNNIPNPTQTVLDATGLMTVTVRGQSVTLHEVTLLLGGGSYATAAGAMRGAGIKIGGVGIR